MRHDVSASAHGVRLRPVRDEDAAFIVQLRNSPHAAGRIGSSAKTVDDQLEWLRRHYEIQDDYLFMIETTGNDKVCGMLGIYGIRGSTGEWGRWVIQPGVPAAAASALLALEICFERLSLDTIRALIVSTNREVIAFHERIGYEHVSSASEARVIDGSQVVMAEYRASRAQWPMIRLRLESHAKVAHSWMRTIGEPSAQP
jgi:RimJ/RimL family protein N-acetyltransferase